MPKITITREHSKTREELVPLINTVREKLEQRYDIDSEWQSDNCVEFERIGLNGTLEFTDAQVNVIIEIGFVLGAFKGKIEQELNTTLDKALG